MSAPFDTNTYRAVVLSHHDADTSHIAVMPGFDLTINLTVRWAGINAPEISTPAGKTSLAWLNEQLPAGSTVTLQTIKDRKEKYGRYLGTFLDGTGVNINQAMIEAGMAVAYDGGPR
jgi:micrococcal nuclease